MLNLNMTGFGYLISGQLQKNIQTILGDLATLQQSVNGVNENMTETRAQLDSAIAGLGAEITTTLQGIANQLETDVASLISQIQAGADFTTEANSIASQLSALQSIATALQATDTNVEAQLPAPTPTPPAS